MSTPDVNKSSHGGGNPIRLKKFNVFNDVIRPLRRSDNAMTAISPAGAVKKNTGSGKIVCAVPVTD
ncbi:hypothetical protein [Bradyrhizobium sp. WD16]|uniref:hypothetical protein n=1 Tax=Bradyrhizobium sp. WD16 TaxID=1521768 RepID=UPI0020A559D8|nr:hypothetical protein [Bradyrhizobium sp. WD16]